MAPNSNEEKPSKSGVTGLSDEILTVVKDKEFQTTVGLFVKKNETFFRTIKGLGFMIALLSGLFGYLLKANSEADDRRAEAIHKVIQEKIEWMKKTNNAIMEVRKTRYLIKLDCDHKKPVSSYEQDKRRFEARHQLANATAGLTEIFGESVHSTIRELATFDESVTNVCAPGAPDDEAWRAFMLKIDVQIHQSIEQDRQELEALGHGVLNTFL